MMSPPPEALAGCIPTRSAPVTRVEVSAPIPAAPAVEQPTWVEIREQPIVDPAAWVHLIVLPGPALVLAVLPGDPDGCA